MDRDFVTTLKSEYEKRERESENVTKKSNQLMTVSAIMATLMTGFFGVSQPERLQTGEVSGLPWLVPVGFLLAVICIACIKLNKAEDQMVVFLGTSLVNDSEVDPDDIDKWLKLKDGEYFRILAGNYLQCLTHAESIIRSKYRWHDCITGMFVAGMVSFPIAMVMAIMSG